MTYKIKVRNNLISVEETVSLTSGNKDNIAFVFEFLEGWEEYPLRYCSFIRAGKCITAFIENNKCTIPYEYIRKPLDFKMGVFGADGEMEKRISTNLLTFSVEPGAYREDATIAQDAPVEIWEELVLKTVPKIGENNNWFLWDIKTQDYVDTGICASVEGMEKTKNKTKKISQKPSDERYPTEKAVADYTAQEIQKKAAPLIFNSEDEMYKYLDDNFGDVDKGRIISVVEVDSWIGLLAYKIYVYGGGIASGTAGTGYYEYFHNLKEIYPGEVEFKTDKITSIKGLSKNSTDEQYPSAKAVVEYVAENSGKANVITSITDTLVLEDRQDAQLGELSALILAMPEEVNTTYSSAFSFISGEAATALTYSDTPVIWRGDDCDSEGAFVPESNTMYEVSVKYVNTNPETNEPVIVARVGAI